MREAVEEPEESSEEDDTEAGDSRMRAVILTHFGDLGVFYAKETLAHWILFLAHMPKATCKLNSLDAGGITVTWNVDPVPADVLYACREVTGLDISEYGFEHRVCRMYFPAPRPLNTNMACVQKRYLPRDECMPCQYTLLVLPFAGDEETVLMDL